MCGRYALAGDWSEFAQEFDLEEVPGLSERYNIAPSYGGGYEAPIITGRGVSLARFWYIPSFWSEPLKKLPTSFNARSETVHEKPFFAGALRCLVPTSGWREFPGPSGKKKAYHFHRGRPFFAMGGICTEWKDPETGEIVPSFSILTCEPNAMVKPYHHRMPLLLAKDQYAEWLRVGSTWSEVLPPALEESEGGYLEHFECSTFGNSTRNEGPQCIARVASQQSLF